jgi:hypothetical protein
MQNNNPHDIRPPPVWIPEPNYDIWHAMTRSLAVDTAAVLVVVSKTVKSLCNRTRENANKLTQFQEEVWKCLAPITDKLVDHQERLGRLEKTAAAKDETILKLQAALKAKSEELRKVKKAHSDLETLYYNDHKKLEQRMERFERSMSMEKSSRTDPCELIDTDDKPMEIPLTLNDEPCYFCARRIPKGEGPCGKHDQKRKLAQN